MASMALQHSDMNDGSCYSSRFPCRKPVHAAKIRRGITIKKLVSVRIILQKSWHVYGYKRLNVIRSGGYGTVYRARDKENGEVVAIKKPFDGLSYTSMREIDILQSLHGHPSIVELKKVVGVKNGGVYMVMEYMENDLHGHMRVTKRPFAISEVKGFMKQLLEGINFLHKNRVMHRDLKPSNILVSKQGSLKICDFGLSRRFGRGMEQYTQMFGTIYYTAPEMLLVNGLYSSAVDMWSVGCIMAELLMKKVLFKGETEIRQLSAIVRILGTPNRYIPGINIKLVGQHSNVLREKLAAAVPGGPMLTDLGFDLLSKLLAYDPMERITATKALNHGWFIEED